MVVSKIVVAMVTEYMVKDRQTLNYYLSHVQTRVQTLLLNSMSLKCEVSQVAG